MKARFHTRWIKTRLKVKFRTWWQQIKQPVTTLVVAILLGVAIVLIIVEVKVYGTGFQRKTLWDWLQLFIIPLVLAVGGYWLSQIQKDREQKAAEQHAQIEREAADKRAQTEREIAQDNQQEATLQEYINKMSELLLDRKLRESDPDDEVRKIARVRTLTVLPRLNGSRKGSVLEFLSEAGLIDKDGSIVNLSGADLSRADLCRAYLSDADLRGAYLRSANLRGAYLHRARLNEAYLGYADLGGAILRGANLCYANLTEADLTETDLTEADLSGAKVFQEQLIGAISLKGATMPDWKKLP